jgi:hypothetical protein
MKTEVEHRSGLGTMLTYSGATKQFPSFNRVAFLDAAGICSLYEQQLQERRVKEMGREKQGGILLADMRSNFSAGCTPRSHFGATNPGSVTACTEQHTDEVQEVVGN